jgi:phage shock protein A
MGIARRVAELYEAKVNALLDRAEDPRQMLDYSYAQQQDYLRRIRGAVAEVAASRKRAGLQESELRHTAGRLRTQAEQCVAAGRQELGRNALRLRVETVAHADDLAAEQAQLRAEEERLREAARRLEHRTEAFRYQKEALKAAYTAAEATAAADQADLFADAGEVTEASRRAEDQTAALQARAEALAEQDSAGATGPILPQAAYRIQEQLDAVSREAAVEEELAKIRKQVARQAASDQPGTPDGRKPKPY